MAPELAIFFEKYCVFATLPKLFVQCAGVHITKGTLLLRN
jgi:hypothetical protein